MLELFGMRKMKLWIISSRNFETLVAASDKQQAIDVFYVYHPAERGDVFNMSKEEFRRAGQTGREARGTWLKGKFHTYIEIKKHEADLWILSTPKVLYTHADVKMPMGHAKQGGEGVMIYFSKLQIKMLDTVIKEVMPSDTRSKMGGRMITMLHQILDGTINRLPANWDDARKALKVAPVPEEITKWSPPELTGYPKGWEPSRTTVKPPKIDSVEQASCNEAFLDPKDMRSREGILYSVAGAYRNSETVEIPPGDILDTEGTIIEGENEVKEVPPVTLKQQPTHDWHERGSLGESPLKKPLDDIRRYNPLTRRVECVQPDEPFKRAEPEEGENHD